MKVINMSRVFSRAERRRFKRTLDAEHKRRERALAADRAARKRTCIPRLDVLVSSLSHED